MKDKEVLRKFLGQHGPEKKKKFFISLFGLEVKKIIFLGFTRCKTEGK